MCAKSLQSYPTLWDPVDYSPPDSSGGILQARILEWVAMFSSRESSRPRDQTCISRLLTLADRFFTISTTWEAPEVSLESFKSKGIKEKLWSPAEVEKE